MIKKIITCKTKEEASSKGHAMYKKGYKFNDSFTNMRTKVFWFIVTKGLREKISFMVENVT